jgi:succinoglycan biosynthesis transport protein ExoP
VKEMQMETAVALSNRGFTPRAGVEAFFRRKRLFFWIVLATLAVALLVTFLTPRQYASEMKFLVQNTRGNVPLTPERTNLAATPNDVTDTQVNSELELLHSHDVVDQIADPGWIIGSEDQRDPRSIRRHEKLLAAFDKRFRTEAVIRTNIINASILADTPEKAKEELEHLSASYLAEHRRLQRPVGATGFFASEAERVRKDWDKASQRLVDFQRGHQILSLSNREAALEAQITEHERDLLASDALLNGMDAKLAGSSRRLRDLPMRQITEQKVLPNPESLGHLNTLLVELENRRTALLTNYKEDDRAVRELDQQIATTKATLADASRMTSHEETTDVDPAWQLLHKDYLETEISRQQMEAHRTSTIAELTKLKQDLAGLQGLTVEFNNLEAQSHRLKENYELYAQKRDQAQIEDAMDEQKLLNVTIAQQPTLSYEVARPKRLPNIILGAVTSIVLGFCALYFIEASRNTIATPREFDGLSRHPLLATVPRISLWAEGLVEHNGKAKPRAITLGITSAIAERSAQAHDSALLSGLSVGDKKELERAQLPTRYEGLLFRIIPQSEHAKNRGYVVMLTSPTRGAGVSQITDSLANLLNRGGRQAAVALDCRHLGNDHHDLAKQPNPGHQTGTESSFPIEDSLSSIGNVHAVRESFMISLDKLRRKYRYVLVDCPSLKEAQDAVLLAPLVDGIVLVVEADRTRAEQLFHAERTLESAKGKILGHILNKRSYVVPDWLCRKMEAVDI